jgi:hypothetical protein
LTALKSFNVQINLENPLQSTPKAFTNNKSIPTPKTLIDNKIVHRPIKLSQYSPYSEDVQQLQDVGQENSELPTMLEAAHAESCSAQHAGKQCLHLAVSSLKAQYSSIVCYARYQELPVMHSLF